MCGLSDLYDIPLHELAPALAEMDRLLRIVPFSPAPATAANPVGRPPAAAGAGDSLPEHGATA